MQEWLNKTQVLIESNSFVAWIAVAGLSFVFALGLKFVLTLISVRLRKIVEATTSKWDDVAVDVMDGLKFTTIAVWTFYLSSKSLKAPPLAEKIILFMVVSASVYQIGLWGLYLIKNWRAAVIDHRVQQEPSSAAALGLLYTIIQGLFIFVLIMIGMSNLGINISALITGLGVGGVAIAFAAQNVLGDLLASLAIVLDKPFLLGDFIVAGDIVGNVAQIGVKTTRIATLSGEELVVSNKNLLESHIQNFAKMRTRRIVQTFSIALTTPPEKIQQIPGWVKEAVNHQTKVKFDRCHLAKFGPSSFDYEFVFIIQDGDYNLFMDIQQAILFEIMNHLAAEKVALAIPARSLHVDHFPALDAMPENKTSHSSESRPIPRDSHPMNV